MYALHPGQSGNDRNWPRWAECRLNEKHVALPLLFIVRDAELDLRALNASRPDVSRRPSPPLERGTKSLTEHASRSSTGTLLSHTMVPKIPATYRNGSREGMSSEAAATLSRRYTRSFQGLPGPRTVHGAPEEPLLSVAAVFFAWLLVGSPTADSWHVGLSAWPAVKTGGTGFASDGVRDFRLAVSTTQSVGDVDGSGRSVGIGVSWLLLTTADYGLNDQPEKGRPKTNVNASRDDGCGLAECVREHDRHHSHDEEGLGGLSRAGRKLLFKMAPTIGHDGRPSGQVEDNPACSGDGSLM
ncbi:hypothetical protein PCL_08869 [Purpureocillium lilacinum]|uniref:Uncharacterized protein n=1 Tax=Purpureocillium lilacinum TaxID=33203 RepID=A0A2U3EGI5_PURLI|nr:hypothetical protein PCL_08869 [Purpureocillium lilacinum]